MFSDIIDEPALFYIFAPLFDWLIIFSAYQITKYIATYLVIERFYSLEIREKVIFIFQVSIANAVLIGWLIYVLPNHHYSLVYHILKLIGLITIPSLIGIFMGFISRSKMTDEQIWQYRKKQKENSH